MSCLVSFCITYGLYRNNMKILNKLFVLSGLLFYIVLVWCLYIYFYDCMNPLLTDVVELVYMPSYDVNNFDCFADIYFPLIFLFRGWREGTPVLDRMEVTFTPTKVREKNHRFIKRVRSLVIRCTRYDWR